MAKGAAQRKSSSSKRQQQHDPMADKRAARVNSMRTANDAGFEGQDAFMTGDDEVSFGEHGDPDPRDFDLLDDTAGQEVLSLGLDDGTDAATQRSGKSKKGSRRDVASPSAPAQPSSSTSKSKRTLQSDRQKSLLPLTDARTSRFQKPATGTRHSSDDDDDEDEEGPDHAGGFDGSSSGDDSGEQDDEDEDEEDWARSGGFHVSKGEIRRAEERLRDDSRTVSEEEERRIQLELFESRKVQSKSREALEDDDFGVDALDEQIAHKPQQLSVSIRNAAPTQAPSVFNATASRPEAIAHLVAKDPVLLPLLDDFALMSERMGEFRVQVKKLEMEVDDDHPKTAFTRLYQELLSTYLATLAYYLHLRAHPSFGVATVKLGEVVLARLAKIRSGISTLDDLGVVDSMGGHTRQDTFTAGSDDSGDEMGSGSSLSGLEEMGEDEIRALLEEQRTLLASDDEPALQHCGSTASERARSKKRKAGMIEPFETQEKSNTDPTQSKRAKRRARAKAAASPDPAAGLLNLQAGPVTAAQPDAASALGLDNDLVDPVSLSTDEAAEKEKRKKSLRFYTSRIDAKSAKRSATGKQIAGGDDDIPYRSKEKARAAVLQRQQHAGPSDDDTRLDTASSAGDDLADVFETEGGEVDPLQEDAQDYYELVGKAKRARKNAKETAYIESALAERSANDAAHTFDPNNPRAVNRMIMANKGLTPRRPKSVRNPRVKKRMRYDQAQKKVASMKPVYKGGLGSGSYEGEKSGISSRVVKSRSL